MKKVGILLLLILLSAPLLAQQSFIQGVVAVFNSEFETGKRQYVPNAQVEEDYGKSQATTTSTDGTFKLRLIGIKDLEQVFFSVKKPSYEVVNTDALQATAGQKESIRVYMAPEGRIAENKLKYYKINREAAEKALTDRITSIGKQIEELQKNANANQAKIKILQVEYAQLQEQFLKIDDNAKELAERYAKTNLDDQSKDYQKAFRYFQQGQLDSALSIFKVIDLESSAAVIIREQERNENLGKEYRERDSLKNLQKEQVNNALSFKADLHQTKFEFDKVEECYNLMLKLDSTNTSTLWRYAYFLNNQKKDQKAILLYEKALSLAKTDGIKAIFLNNLGNLYTNNRRMPEAVKAYEEALKIRRQLATQNPNSFLSDIAQTLNNLGFFYKANQELPGAKKAYDEALQVYRQLAAQNPDIFLPELATTLNNIANYFYNNQKMLEAGKTYEEVLEIRRQLAAQDPGVFLPHLAQTLIDLGNYYNINQQLPLAQKSFEEALKILRLLATQNPDAFLPHLAQVLAIISTYYIENQQISQAEKPIEEALQIYRQSAAKNPSAFLPDLANILNRIGVYYLANQQMLQAEKSFKEALQILRQLVAENPDAFLPDLTTTLNNIGNYFYTNQMMSEAEKAFEEALQFDRQLATKNPEAFLPDLATTLSNLGVCFHANQKMLQAEKAYEEALAIRRQLTAKNPDAYLPHLFETLNNLGNYYSDNQQMSEAEKAYQEALQIVRNLATENPDAFLSDLATALYNLGVFNKNLKKYDSALKNYGDALKIREEMFLVHGTSFFQDWVKILRSIDEVRDSVQVQKDFVNVVKAGQLLAESFYRLKELNNQIFDYAISDYGDLSWWALFAKDYPLAEKASLRCLELDNTQQWVLTNLGHSYLLRGQYKQAQSTYEKLKGKKDEEGKDYKQIILEDFEALEKEDITHPDIAKMKAWIESW